MSELISADSELVLWGLQAGGSVIWAELDYAAELDYDLQQAHTLFFLQVHLFLLFFLCVPSVLTFNMPQASAQGDDNNLEDDPSEDGPSEEDEVVEEDQLAASQTCRKPASQPPVPNVSSAVGLSPLIITALTHNQLRENHEFMRYVDLVTMLQELLKLRQAPSFAFFLFFFFFQFFFHLVNTLSSPYHRQFDVLVCSSG